MSCSLSSLITQHPSLVTALELLPEQLIDQPGVGLAPRLLHHRADEEAQRVLPAAAVVLDGPGVPRVGQYCFDDGLELTGVAHLRQPPVTHDGRRRRAG